MGKDVIEVAKIAMLLMFEGVRWNKAIKMAVKDAPRVVRESDVAAAIEVMA
jgi:hypothetical protein